MANWTAVSFDNSANEKIAQAADFERTLRLESLLGAESTVFGVRLRQVTIADILQLQYVENKLLSQESPPDESDYCHFFWLLKAPSEKRSQKQLFNLILKHIFSEDKSGESVLYLEVNTFLNIAFNDLPPTSKNLDKSYQANPNVWIAGIIDTIASQYGWSYDEIVNSPLARILHLHQYILKRLIGDKYSIRSPITNKASFAELAKQQNG